MPDRKEERELAEVVSARGLCKTYKLGKLRVEALRGVDLTMRAGEFTVLAGPSGSGKTTLLNLVGALDRLTAGELHVGGHDLSAMSSAQLARFRRTEVGFVFQAYNLLPVLSALENAELVLELQGKDAATCRREAKRMLEAVGLGELAQRRPAELSGGQQQRVAVARAIATSPKLVLADEPTANLDSTTGNALLDTMVGLNEQQGVTFLFSSHDPKVIERARRVLHLVDGRIADERRVS
jgi:putative ABC transport system ATP-binding protein